jgi:Flp pilus assembly protein TadG
MSNEIRLTGSVERFDADTRGGVMLWAGLVLPAIAALGFGAVELAAASADRSRLQNAADAAVLSSALELGVSPDTAVIESAEALALAQAAGVSDAATVTAAAQVLDEGKSLELVMTSRRDSLLGRLGPGVWRARVRAVAQTMNRTPRCVVGLSRGTSDVVRLADQAALWRPDARCIPTTTWRSPLRAGSSRDRAGRRGRERADRAGSGRRRRAVGGPFRRAQHRHPPLSAAERGGATAGPQVGRPHAAAGIHCGDVYIRKTATLNLAAGEHYFLGDLIVGDTARLNGADVALFFGRGAQLTFRGKAVVDLAGRKRGQNAGLLIVTGRDNVSDFQISSDNVRRLEGVVYMPASRLLVSGTGQVAGQSEWTVTVTKALQVSGSPTLVINNDYAGSSVRCRTTWDPGSAPSGSANDLTGPGRQPRTGAPSRS